MAELDNNKVNSEELNDVAGGLASANAPAFGDIKCPHCGRMNDAREVSKLASRAEASASVSARPGMAEFPLQILQQRNPALKSIDRRLGMKKIIVLCLAAVMVLSLAACGNASSPGSSANPKEDASVAETKVDPAVAEYLRAEALFEEGKFFSAKEAFENSGYGDFEKRAAECVQPMPETGELWHDEKMKSDTMTLGFVVEDEDPAVGRYIEVLTENKDIVEKIFIKGTEQLETYIPAGRYYIKQAFGTEWYGEKELFGRDGKYQMMTFDEVEGDPNLTVLDDGYGWVITINTENTEGTGVGAEDKDWENW